MKKPKSSRKKLELALDKAWSEKIRSVAFCAVCGPYIKQEVLHAHHIFSRKHKATRWDLENGICLCPRHHLYFAHKDIMEFGLWVLENKGAEFIDKLRWKAMSVSKWSESDLEILLAELKK